LSFEQIFGVTFSQILIGFSRASGMIMTAPIFQSRNIPPPLKVILAFGLAMVVAPFIVGNIDFSQFTFGMTVFILLQELLTGLIMGFMINLTLYAVQIAGYYFDVEMGFGMINILDPTTGTQMPIMGQINYIVTLLVFLAINGHHTIISSFIQSYQVIKPGMFLIKKEAVGVFVMAFSNMFYFGFKIGIPIIATIFLSNVALGIIAKLIPQINVFIIGYPVKIILGLLMIIFFIPVFVILIEATFSNSGDTFKMMRLMLRHLH
jgi:flagellar biosynthetic protein FliR